MVRDGYSKPYLHLDPLLFLCFCSPDSTLNHLSWAETQTLQGQNSYLLNTSSELLPKMGNGGNKEAITENKVTAAVEIEKLRDIPAFHLIIPPKRERCCFSVLWLENDIPSALSALKEIILNNVCLVFLYLRETRALNAAGKYSFFPSSICVRLCQSFYTNIPVGKEKKLVN